MSPEIEIVMKALDNLHRLTQLERELVNKLADKPLNYEHTPLEKTALQRIQQRLY